MRTIETDAQFRVEDLPVRPIESYPTCRMITPDHFEVDLPNSPEYEEYQHVRIRRIDRLTDPEHFAEKAKAYIRATLHKGDIASFTWPIYKLDLDEYSDEQLYRPDGSPTEFFVNLAYDHYLVPTIDGRGNHLLVIEDERTDPDTRETTHVVIGGGLSFGGVNNENEGWFSKGVVLPEHRRKGFGRLLQKSRIDSFFLHHTSDHIMHDKSNLNTGVNVERSELPYFHRASLELIRGVDIIDLLQSDATVDVDVVRNMLEAKIQWMRMAGYPDYCTTPNEAKLHNLYELIEGSLPIFGYTPESLYLRKRIVQAVLSAFGQKLSPTERNILAYGGRLLNGIEDSAITKPNGELVYANTRRWIIRREDWLPLQPADIQERFKESYSQN